VRTPFAFALAVSVALLGAGTAFARPDEPGSARAPAEKVDLNSANVDELLALPGVGEAIAKKIVAGRPYTSVDDLAGAGVNASTIEKIKGLVTVSRKRADPKPSAGGAKPRPGERLDLNRATEDELLELPGVGAVTAEKIVAGRPYSSVDDLAKAGVSAKTLEKIRTLVTVTAPKAPKPAPRSVERSGAIDLNTASLEQLIELPGVGEVTAKKIVAGRPYASLDDLTEAGVGASTIAKIKAAGAVVSRAEAKKRAGKVDLNAATEDELIALPGVGEVTARKIIAGRPYATIDDLESAGLTENLIAKIENLVTVGGRPLPPQPKGDPAPGGGGGKVWVNLRSGIFHAESSRWYGRTKEGRYMAEAEARDDGFRAVGETWKEDLPAAGDR
jgi:competence protein ComEA